jgi:hypothetical protein
MIDLADATVQQETDPLDGSVRVIVTYKPNPGAEPQRLIFEPRGEDLKPTVQALERQVKAANANRVNWKRRFGCL